MKSCLPRVLRGGGTVLQVSLALSILLLAPLPAAAAPPGADGAPRGAFARADSVSELARTARGLRLGDRLHVEGVELGGEPVGLDLERFEVFAPGGEVVVHGEDGEEVRPFGDHVYFRGPVIGEPGSLAVLTVPADGEVRGIVRREGAVWSLAPGAERADGSRGLSALRPETKAGEPAPSFQCGNDGLVAPDMAGALARDGSSRAAKADVITAATTTPYTVRVAVETDWELWQKLGGATGIENYVGDLIAFASSMYDAEIHTNLVVSYLSTWSNSGDPWGQTSSSCALYEFGRYWNDNRSAVDRTIAHFVSGKNTNSGVAWVGVLCNGGFNVDLGGSCAGLTPSVDNYGGAYGFTGSIDGDFNPASPNKVWDIIAVSHEIGHNFNSPHTHCYNGIGGSSQPVDQCYAGEAAFGCYSGSTSLPGPAGTGSGTIMSYCHLLSPGFSNISFTFGTTAQYGTLPQRVPDRMRAHVENRVASDPACLAREEPGGGPTDPPCPDELLLLSGTVNGTALEQTCGVIYAGGIYKVGTTGDLTLRAFRVVLQDGFSVQTGGSLTIDPQ